MPGKATGVAESEPIFDKLKVTGNCGFYGKTPITQPSATNQAAPASTAPVSISATQWGFSTSTQAAALTNCLIEIRTALVNLGLIKGSN